MPGDLFGPVTRPFDGVGGRSRLTVPVSLAAHVVVVAAVVVVPLLATDALPALREPLSVSMITPVVPAPPPLRRVAPPPTRLAVANPEAAPIEAPSGVAPEPEWQRDRTFFEDRGPGLLDGIEHGAQVLTPPPPPPAPEPPATVRVSSGVTAPTRIHDVAPVYPPIAVQAHIEGLVIIEATIGVDGAVTDARVLRSEPLLADAALQAVRQWRYTPTRLDGRPVAVVMTVTVNFRLR
ncbi:MAG: TonB family protein [Vicinamibacterales bacterium]